VNIVSMFRQMLKREWANQLPLVNVSHIHVYILPIFEVSSTSQVPDTKLQLQQMIRKGDASPSTSGSATPVRTFVDREKWANETRNHDQINIFRKTKRNHTFWEPLYIGPMDEPLYEERLSWDGSATKCHRQVS